MIINHSGGVLKFENPMVGGLFYGFQKNSILN